MSSLKHRVLSGLLCILMVLSVIPAIPFVNEVMTPSQLIHRSEIELDNYTCQYHIVNTTFENLEDSVNYIIEEIEPTPIFTMTIGGND